MTSITGTLIKNYFHCKRQAYLFYYGLNFWNESMKIGQLMHDEKKGNELLFEKIKIDDIKDNTLIEYKKTSSNLEGTIYQLLYYLKYFKLKGIILDGKIVDLTYNQEYLIKLTEDKEKELNNVLNEIEQMLSKETPNKLSKKADCKDCSFIDYCWCD